MILHLPAYLLMMLLMIPPPSLQYPIPLKNDKLIKIVEPEPVYASLESLEGHHPLPGARQKRDEPEEWTEGDQQEALNADTLETMRKINPLTIANQVSQLFRKNDQKSSHSEKSSSRIDQNTLGNEEESCRSEDSQEVSNFAVQPEVEELVRNPSAPYVLQEPPKIVNKPRTNDLGYSVIVLAGDPVNLPIKVLSKGVQEGQNRLGKEGLECKTDEKEKPDKNSFYDEQSGPKEKASNEEMRVPKQYNVKTDFPVYDEDLNFIPDPFQGILDENYLKEQSRQEATQTERRFQPHAVYIRSSEGRKDVISGEFQCGSWKKNASDTLKS